MRLYIVGPMTGYPAFNYPAFNDACRLLLNAGYEVRNPARGHPAPPASAEGITWEWYLRRGLRDLLDCDAIAVLPGVSESRGAIMEIGVATALKMEVRPVEEWVERGAPRIGRPRPPRPRTHDFPRTPIV